MMMMMMMVVSTINPITHTDELCFCLERVVNYSSDMTPALRSSFYFYIAGQEQGLI